MRCSCVQTCFERMINSDGGGSVGERCSLDALTKHTAIALVMFLTEKSLSIVLTNFKISLLMSTVTCIVK